jgi:hypothetical protein
MLGRYLSRVPVTWILSLEREDGAASDRGHNRDDVDSWRQFGAQIQRRPDRARSQQTETDRDANLVEELGPGIGPEAACPDRVDGAMHRMFCQV